MDNTQTIKLQDTAVEATQRLTGKEAIIKCLLAEGVDTLYGYPGGAIMPVYDELYKYQDKLHHVLTRHEQGATHAAQGYARVSGRVGVAIATSGPGATNLITGIADAQIDSTPMVCITGQVASHLLGSDAFQETDIIGISTPVTKWNYQITKASEIPEVMAKAFYIAKSGRPGPVLIDITKDAQFETFDYSYEKCSGIRSYTPITTLSNKEVEKAVEMINKSEKPLVVWGQGVILGNAEEELKIFLENKISFNEDNRILGLLIKQNEQIVGSIFYYYQPNFRYKNQTYKVINFATIYVLESHRGKGISKLMLNKTLEIFKDYIITDYTPVGSIMHIIKKLNFGFMKNNRSLIFPLPLINFFSKFNIRSSINLEEAFFLDDKYKNFLLIGDKSLVW